jgi:hypothetical protein
MTKRYTGGVISSSLPTVNAAGASGVFLLSQQADAQSRNAWPPYKIEESLRFRSSASAYLNRTPASAGNRKTMTFSFWVKRGFMSSTQQNFISAGTGSDNYIAWSSTNDYIEMNFRNGGSGSNVFLITTQVFRDPSAWYHIVLAIDTTQATAANRVKLYVNGTQITVFGTENYPTQNNDLNTFGNNVIHHIGQSGVGGFNFYLDGYLTEFYYVDGQQLTPSSFGATDKDGNWSPIAYTGTYGTNGFYVNFRDNTSATTMGYDYSGNGNNWTLNGFNVSTANTSYDIMIDVPSDQSDGTANNRGNYCTFNPLSTSSRVTVSDGNLKIAKDSFADWNTSLSSFLLSSGKWYWEFTLGTTTNVYFALGYVSPGFNYSSDSFYPGRTSNSYAIDANTGNKRTNDTTASYGSTYASNDVVMLAIDLDTKQIWFGKNGQWGNGSGSFNQTFANSTVAFSSIATPLIPAVGMYTSENGVANFGQRPFTYTPPSGFKALNTFNLSDPTIKQPNRQFDAVIWTGDQTNKQIPLNFTADFVWAKRRNNSDNHVLYDAIRGVNNGLNSNTTGAEATNNYGLDFDNGNYLDINGSQYFGGGGGSGITFVAWNWNAGGSTVTNTTGTISAQVRANPTAGFSIATYTGNGTGGATVGHGLGVTPSMVIVKKRSGIADWPVQHISLGPNASLRLNGTNATTNEPWWNSTAPSSTVFTLGNSNTINQNGETFVAYCFAEVAGYSAFGSYTGNGSTDGPFAYTGFRPKFVLVKASSNSTSSTVWNIWDTSRSPSNPALKELYANLADGEGTDSNGADLLSNGFKPKRNSEYANFSGWTYIYAAFAEMPFKYARAR